MNDNPFAEPDDSDAPLVRPRPVQPRPVQPGLVQPGLVQPGPVHRPADAAGPDPAQIPPSGEDSVPADGGDFSDMPGFGPSPVLSAAAPLLTLLSRLRSVSSVPDPALLRERTVAEFRRFEEQLRAGGQPMDVIRASHYALCASLDDVVRNTPWGGSGPWADISLVAAFHGEVLSGERFFDVLAQLCRNQGRLLPVIELMYVCMSLGMQGRYRLSQRGPAELDRLREETYALIMRQRRPAERALSPHWRGISAPYRPLRAGVPVWVAAMAALALLALAYGLLALRVNEASDRLFEAVAALPPGHMPAIARPAPVVPVAASPPRPDARDGLRASLAPDIAQGLVEVVGTDAVPVLRVHTAGLFRSGSAVVESRFLPLLARIGATVKASGQDAVVAGYTDDQPIRTVAFPSNFQLSQARARASAAVIAAVADPARLAAEGRADADPIAGNDTAAGREQNRRIEVILHPTETK